MTTVPLQRLFLMNSDFVQIEAEELAKRVAGEPDNRARIRKLYQFIYGRVPSESELALGVEYLKTEPMQEYEEWKKAKDAKAAPAKPAPAIAGEDMTAKPRYAGHAGEGCRAGSARCSGAVEPPAGMMAGVGGRPARGRQGRSTRRLRWGVTRKCC